MVICMYYTQRVFCTMLVPEIKVTSDDRAWLKSCADECGLKLVNVYLHPLNTQHCKMGKATILLDYLEANDISDGDEFGVGVDEEIDNVALLVENRLRKFETETRYWYWIDRVK